VEAFTEALVVALDEGALVSRLKLIVSTTSVSPSQRPRESPIHRANVPCERLPIGTMRASWIISV
jgi:hypothetical protein